MVPGPAHAGIPLQLERHLFDDPVAERAISFLEPVLSRATQAARRGAEAERWANLVYLLHKVLQTRPTGSGKRSYIWPMHRRTVRDLVAASEPNEEQPLMVALLEALDEEELQQPATRAFLGARAGYASWLEDQGYFAEALALFALTSGPAWAAPPAGETLRATRTVARLYRKLARWDAADRGYQAVTRLAEQFGDEENAIRGMLGQAITMRGRGNLGGARALMDALSARALGSSAALRSNISLDYGVLLEQSGNHVGALAKYLEAAALSDDADSLVTIMGNIGVVLAQLGRWQDALAVQQRVRRAAARWEIRTNADIECLGPLSHLDPAAFDRLADELLDALPLMPPAMRVDTRYQIAEGLARLGYRDRARSLLVEALSDAATHQLHHWYFKLERSCDQLLSGDAAIPVPVEPEPVAAAQDETLGRLMAGVRAFSALVGA